MSTEDTAGTTAPAAREYRPPAMYDPLRVVREEIAASIDAEGRPTGDYWTIMGLYAAKQFRAAEATRKMMVFFTWLVVIGLIAGLIIGIVGAVQLSHLTTMTTTDPFGVSTP